MTILLLGLWAAVVLPAPAAARAGDAGAQAALPAAYAQARGAFAGHPGLFPTQLTLPRFERLGRPRIFLAKHRLRGPGRVARVSPEDVASGRCLVQAGVEVEGVVTRVHPRSVDGDVDFEMGPLWLEITPELRRLGPRVPVPRVGDLVRVRGWTYYDVFHDAPPRPGAAALSQWEVHPVTSLRVLRPARR